VTVIERKCFTTKTCVATGRLVITTG